MTDYWLVFVSYIIGLFPSAYIAGRLLKGVDVRKVGDGNAGAANVFRNISHTGGAIVLAVDIAKGAIAVLLSLAVASLPVALLCGLGVVAGHNWPLFLRFKGGRGMATTFGVLLALLPIPMAVGSAAGIISLWKKQNLLVTGCAIFVPTLLLAWLLKTSTSVILYSMALLCLGGTMHWVTTRRLSPEQRKEAIRWK